MKTVDINITSYTHNPAGDVHTLTFTRADQQTGALELEADEQTSIEVPSRAPHGKPAGEDKDKE